MKKVLILLVLTGCVLIISCNKEKRSERFMLLTEPVWLTESLLANGADAGGPGGLLEKFKGEAKFREDGTGSFGKYSGRWNFNSAETQLTIRTDSLPLPVICDIEILTTQNLKISADVPNPKNLQEIFDISMTFKVK